MIVALISGAYGVRSQTLTQPVAPIREVADEYFGQKVTDPYRWMETPRSEELSDWMKAQNAYTRSLLDRTPTRDTLLKRIDELTDAGVAVSSVAKVGYLYFYLKIAPG